MPRNALKREIKEALHKELVKQRTLSGETEVTGVATNPVFSDDLEALEMELKSEEDISIDPGNPSSPKEKLLAIRLKKLDVELGRQQYQSQLLHVRALELETKRDIRLKELEIEQKSGQTRRPSSPGLQGNAIPVPAITSSYVQLPFFFFFVLCLSNHFK